MALWEKSMRLQGPLMEQLKALYGPKMPIEVRHYLSSWIESQSWSEVDPDDSRFEADGRRLLEGMLHALQDLYTNATNFIVKTQVDALYTHMRNEYLHQPLELVRVVQTCLSREAELVERQEQLTKAVFHSFEWQSCKALPTFQRMQDAQTIVLDNKVYVGAGDRLDPSGRATLGSNNTVCVYDVSGDLWNKIQCPTYHHAVTAYNNQLALVGGIHHSSHALTNELWVLQGEWTHPLPPMPTKRCNASAVSIGSHLAVAGGHGLVRHDCPPFDTVEIYDGHEWTAAESLSKPSYCMKSVRKGDTWYLMGGKEQGQEVYYASLKELIATTSSNPATSAWKKLPKVPFENSTPAVFMNDLIAIGGKEPVDPLSLFPVPLLSQFTSKIYVYSTITCSWVHVGDMPNAYHSTCATTLPSGELFLVGTLSDPRRAPMVHALDDAVLKGSNKEYEFTAASGKRKQLQGSGQGVLKKRHLSKGLESSENSSEEELSDGSSLLEQFIRISVDHESTCARTELVYVHPSAEWRSLGTATTKSAPSSSSVITSSKIPVITPHIPMLPVMPYNPLGVATLGYLSPVVERSLFRKSSAAAEPAAVHKEGEEMASQLQAIFDVSQKQLELLSQVINAFPPTLHPHHPKTPPGFAHHPSPSIEYGQPVAAQQHIAAQQMETFGMISPEPPSLVQDSETVYSDIKPKIEQLSTEEKKPSFLDIKPKIELSLMREQGVKTESKVDMDADVKSKEVERFSSLEKNDLIDQLAIKINVVHDVISQLRKQIAMEDEQMAEKDERILKQAKEIAKKDEQIEEQARQICEKDELLVKYQKQLITSGKSPVNIKAHILGSEVIAQKAFSLTQKAVDLNFEGYGFKVHIPEGSLPAELSETQLNVQISLSGQFQIPSNCELVSAVYWVSSPHKFIKPITVEIQHCAALSSDKQCSQLTFIHTKCTQKKLPYVFEDQVGGVFSNHSSYGSVSLSHFSGLGIVRRLLRIVFGIQASEQQQQQYHQQQLSESSSHSEAYCQTGQQGEIVEQYCAQLYTSKLAKKWKVDFVVTKNLDSCLTVVKNEYSSLGKPLFSFPFAFEEDYVSLKIPEKDIELGGWKIIPLYNPKITRQDVNCFSSGKRIPKCELLLQWNQKAPPACLQCQIDLLGACDGSYFLLDLDPDADIPPSVEISGGPSSLSSQEGGGISSKPLLNKLTDALYHKVADRWKVIGVLIEIPKGTLSGIAKKCRDDPQNCLVEMLGIWLERVYPPPTWAAIIEAVEFLGEEQLGKELRDKYCPTGHK